MIKIRGAAADAFSRANLARIEASKKVNLASDQYGEALAK